MHEASRYRGLVLPEPRRPLAAPDHMRYEDHFAGARQRTNQFFALGPIRRSKIAGVEEVSCAALVSYQCKTFPLERDCTSRAIVFDSYLPFFQRHIVEVAALAVKHRLAVAGPQV